MASTAAHRAAHAAAHGGSGSGDQNRDSALAGFKLFAVLADELAQRGIASLRFDDRGVGGSSGDGLEATIEDRASDVEAAVRLLRSRDDIEAGSSDWAQGWDQVTAAARALALRLVEALPERSRNALGDIDNYVDVIVSQKLTAWQSPWFASLLEVRPEPCHWSPSRSGHGALWRAGHPSTS